jgi:4-amino-4-deoxy-L-arabinose transferase-like glycosyltransferase
MKSGWSLALLWAAALIPRLGLAAIFLHHPIGLDDMFQYDMLARSLASGDGYRWYRRADVVRHSSYLERHLGFEINPMLLPEEGIQTTFRAPGYPFFLAGLYTLFGLEDRLPVTRILQALLGASLAPLVAVLARRLGLRPAAGIVAGLAVGAYPILLMYPLGLASENLFIPLFVISLITLLHAGSRRSVPATASAGLAIGAGILTRGAFILFFPLAVMWLWKQRGPRPALALTAIVLAAVLPWSIRNSLILGRPAFVENSFAYNLFVGYHPQGEGAFQTSVAVQPMRFLEDSQRDRWTMQQALAFMREDPWRIPYLLLKRTAYYWGLEDREMVYFYSNNFFGPLPPLLLASAYLYLVLPLALIGASAPLGLMALRHPSARSLCLAAIFGLMFAYLPILAEPRFHLPLVPLLAALAAAAWTTPGLLARLRSGLGNRQLTWWAASVSIILLVAIWLHDLVQAAPLLSRLMGSGGHRLWWNY